MEFDRIIRNGSVIDGSGAKARRADVGILGKTIAAIGDLSAASAKQTDDASGGRKDRPYEQGEGFGAAELSQGLTAILNGNCGVSIAPIEGRFREASKAYLRPILGEIGDVPTGSIAAYHK